MRVGVLGTGMVGRAIGSRLVEVGHEVRIGSRSAEHEGAAAWAAETRQSAGDFRDAAAFGSVVFNCTDGAASVDVLTVAGAENLSGKTLVDVANPLDRSGGGLPTLAVANTDSLGERIQAAFPDARVVKTLNTVNAELMVRPERVPGDHLMFVAGNDQAAKAETVALLGQFGWPAERVIDLGDISGARATEMYIPLWLRLWQALGTLSFNIAVERAESEEH